MAADERTAAQGHRDAELDQPQNLSDERLWEIVLECLVKWQAYPSIPGSLRWSRNGITAASELYKRAAS